jgi:hypothetical protein
MAKACIMVTDQLHITIIRVDHVIFHMHSLDVPAVLIKLIPFSKGEGSIKKDWPRGRNGGVTSVVELTISDRKRH